MNEILYNWLNKSKKTTEVKNTYVEPTKVKIQSTVNEGEGLTFNEKANHIFKQIKQMK